jgi:hypothetical protein
MLHVGLGRLLVVAAIVSTIAGAAFAAEDLKAVFQTRYDALRSAIASRDESVIRAVLARDFVSIEVTGEIQTADQMIAGLMRLPPAAGRRVSTVVTSVAADGDRATVGQHYEMNTRRAGADGLQNDQRVADSTDIWTRASGVWLCLSTRTDELWVYSDGALEAHRVRPTA